MLAKHAGRGTLAKHVSFSWPPSLDLLWFAHAGDQGLSFTEGNAESLPCFEDASFDAYTIAFGIRNVTDRDAALREAYRLLKPGGR